jgi:2-dehydro-3-deoxygalactonokinase
MDKAPAFIGADWGTSNARFLLVGTGGDILEQRSAPGIAQLDGADQIEAVCFGVIDDWIAAYPGISVVMAGMVGSNIGWYMAGYADTPATVTDIAAGLLRFSARGTQFLIAPGLAAIRDDGLPDVMRGEETQIFGCINDETALLCLPGTHSKWAQVSAGAVTVFHTALTGELMDITGRHSILLAPKRPVAATPDAAFLEGVEVARDSVAGLETLLFTVRSRQIAQNLNADDASSYLAGLAIGCEIKSALATYGMQTTAVPIIGSPVLTELYAAALSVFGTTSRQMDGNIASLKGLNKLYKAAML